jgi:hypothetical protein
MSFCRRKALREVARDRRAYEKIRSTKKLRLPDFHGGAAFFFFKRHEMGFRTLAVKAPSEVWRLLGGSEKRV